MVTEGNADERGCGGVAAAAAADSSPLIVMVMVNERAAVKKDQRIVLFPPIIRHNFGGKMQLGLHYFWRDVPAIPGTKRDG